MTEIVCADVSIHDSRFERCTGSGIVARVIVPFCPECEDRPADSGCFHEAVRRVWGQWN
jgi:hypothetical protein